MNVNFTELFGRVVLYLMTNRYQIEEGEVQNPFAGDNWNEYQKNVKTYMVTVISTSDYLAMFKRYQEMSPSVAKDALRDLLVRPLNHCFPLVPILTEEFRTKVYQQIFFHWINENYAHLSEEVGDKSIT